jgi:lipopolysaccharide export system protein LptA
MRRVVRPLILLSILVVLAGVGATYYARLRQQIGAAPAKPAALPPGTLATAHRWDYTQTSKGGMVMNIHADDFREVEGKDELTGVVLDIFNKAGNKYDHVKSAKAEFDMAQGILYSDGEVEITMGVPAGAQPNGRLMLIKSSGVRVERKTGKATTDRLATFQFDRGEGKCVGADYDPQTRELAMHSQVELIWRGTNPKSAPMKVESGELHYKEHDAKVLLSPWSKFTRDTLTLNAGPAIVNLDAADGTIKLVETQQAHGTDVRPERNLEYAAEHLTLDFNDDNQIRKITGVDRARMVSTADTGITTMISDRVIMDFDTSGKDSILQTALAVGHSSVESKPVAKPGVDLADTRILRSETIKTKMRPDGRDLELVETEAPGSIEFVPNRAGQPHRWMNGERMSIAYGEKNQIQSFSSVNVSTRTQKARAKDAKEDPPVELTWSKELRASFQPNSSQLNKLEQWNDFRYQAGDRRAKADRAVLDQPNNRIDLTGKAHVWDSTGSADADKIVLDQQSGDFSAEGNVSSTRMPDKSKDSGNAKKDSGGGMLAEDEPLHARAKKMSSSDNNLQIRYEGNAVLWQGGNRLEADVVEIDRDNSGLKAHGHVISQLLDKSQDDSKSKTGGITADSSKPKVSEPKKLATKQSSRGFTIVKAPELVYDDDRKLAVYKDGAFLEQANMTVKAREIRAFLRDDSNDSSLDHAFADGQVEIHQTAPGRVRDGTSEHAEYYVDEDKVILTEGRPKFVDSLRGNTQGDKLTWFSKDDRLLVNGVESQPVKSLLHRKKK